MFARTYTFRSLVAIAAGTAVALVGLVACGGSTARPSSSSKASSSLPVASSTPAPVSSSAAPLVGVAAPCGAPNLSGARLGVLPKTGSSRLPVVEIGHGSTVAVLIHQTDGDGLCGFWPYAVWLTEHYSIRVVLFDLCDYGQSKCPASAFADDQTLQVAAAVRFARASPTKRVVLVGASMGGALALGSATATHVDAVVDLSGPADWYDAPALPAAKALRLPTLLAVSPDDPYANYDDLRAAFKLIRGTPKRFVTGDGGHGWELLADATGTSWRPLATTVARWITGQYT